MVQIYMAQNMTTHVYSLPQSNQEQIYPSFLLRIPIRVCRRCRLEVPIVKLQTYCRNRRSSAFQAPLVGLKFKIRVLSVIFLLCLFLLILLMLSKIIMSSFTNCHKVKLNFEFGALLRFVLIKS